MPGDVGLVAKLLSEILGFVVDPDGYEQLTRENKLRFLMRGVNECMAKNDWTRCDALFAQYRELLDQAGP
jgi:hypothetical protein